MINISSLVGPSLRVPSFSGNSYLELDTLRCLVFSNSAPSSFKVIIIITIIIIIIIINIITIITIIIIRPKTAKLIFLPGKKLTPVRTIFPPAKIIFPYPKIIFPPPKTNLPPAKTLTHQQISKNGAWPLYVYHHHYNLRHAEHKTSLYMEFRSTRSDGQLLYIEQEVRRGKVSDDGDGQWW